MYSQIGTDMIKELAENTIFSKAALDKRDAQESARPLAKLLSLLQRSDSAETATDCDESPRATNRLADGVAHK